MKESNLMVSVIIPTFKRPNLLPRAIDSVLNQTYKNIEVIIVDDNEPLTEYRKSTEKIMLNYQNDTRVIYVKHDFNKNGAAARNTGIKASKGDYISFLDDDDYYLPYRIDRMLLFLMRNSDYSGVFCGWRKNQSVYLPNVEDSDIKNLLLGKSFIYTPTTLLRKGSVIAIGGWSEKILKHQDGEFIIKYLANGYKLIPLREELVVIDVCDRSQVAIGKKWEDNTRLFLEIMSNYIEKIEKEVKGFKKQVYCNRYLSVMLNYFKAKQVTQGFRIYIHYTTQYPICFNKTIFNYFVKRYK